MNPDDPRYAECDVVDFMEADDATRAQLLEEFKPQEPMEVQALHEVAILVPNE